MRIPNTDRGVWRKVATPLAEAAQRLFTSKEVSRKLMITPDVTQMVIFSVRCFSRIYGSRIVQKASVPEKKPQQKWFAEDSYIYFLLISSRSLRPHNSFPYS